MISKKSRSLEIFSLILRTKRNAQAKPRNLNSDGAAPESVCRKYFEFLTIFSDPQSMSYGFKKNNGMG